MLAVVFAITGSENVDKILGILLSLLKNFKLSKVEETFLLFLS
jgi:hypothetical protein